MIKKPAHAQEILDAFEEHWGREAVPPHKLRYEEPIDDLMLTVLSQNTNDKNRDKAYKKLRTEYPTWKKVAEAPADKIIDAIRVAGLGDTKGPHMQAILKAVKEKFGSYSIKKLASWTTEEARDFLTSLPGVGPKTAAIVLVFDLGRPAFPVDTHISRISRRLGWVPENWPPAKIQEYLEQVLPQERFRGAHLNFLEHGRNVCDARKPKCTECYVKKWCAFGKKAKDEK